MTARAPVVKVEPLPDLLIEAAVRLALAEDLGRAGDITTDAPTNPSIGRGAALARKSVMMRRTLARVLPFTNTHSACCAANTRPRSEAPAWYSTGVRCGEGSHNGTASMWNCFPWWWMARTRDGSV